MRHLFPNNPGPQEEDTNNKRDVSQTYIEKTGKKKLDNKRFESSTFDHYHIIIGSTQDLGTTSFPILI